MRFSTDDGRFGVILTPLDSKELFRFQLIVGGHVVGDDQPCGVGSALHRLRNLRPLDDARVVQAAAPRSLLTTLMDTYWVASNAQRWYRAQGRG